jgi:tetratricopeptide (TPR) repeat protein
MALGNLGSGSVFAGDYANAECYLREAISLFQQMGSQGLAQTLIIEGLRQFLSGRLEESHKTAADGATIAKNIGYPLTQAFSLAVLSMLASLKNDYRLARRLADKSLTLISNKMGVFLGHWAQATASVGLGQTGKAWHQALSVLEISHHLHWYGSMTWPLPAMGIILARQGQPQRAVEILGLYFNHPLKPTGWAEKWSLLIESQKQMQEHLGINRYRMAWERGVGLDLVTAIEALLAERGEAS